MLDRGVNRGLAKTSLLVLIHEAKQSKASYDTPKH
jgi:hypothetical protein